MAFVMTITVWALARQAYAGVTTFRSPDGTLSPTLLINGLVAIVLLGLAAMIVLEALRAVRRPRLAEELTPARERV
jgi:hypothetical protein